MSYPPVARYVDGWGRPGEAAVVALDPIYGRRIGAAWYHLMSPEDRGYGFASASVPLVGIVVVSEHRGSGVGGALVPALMGTVRLQGFDALSLSVRRNNPAAIRLYERNGFTNLFAIDSHFSSWIMKVDLSVRDEGQVRVLTHAESEPESS